MGQALTTLIVSQFHDQCLSHFDQTSFTTQICRTATFTFFFLPYTEALVQYDLATFSMYNINLRATHTMILSIRGVTIPIDLVSSATNSIRQRVVLFKSVTVPTSDPKSEFLCQSSQSVQNLQTP